ncbi:MAG: hypothetical protein PWP16_140 [Eubacteriaceae bacterium]|jgi:hypothetical protein|nr:hypothetical protein [Eubacteriaceae bacterium]MDK2905978.1 hypothetical protein [Eubacteriaceae bacterium]MDN5306777.1 hypothetical protein [Eubacteriaceae bacterium]
MDELLKFQKDQEVFKVLLAHWINHSADHIEGYAEWMEKLKGSSMDAVSQEIGLAIEKMEESRKHLMKAKILF